MAQAPAVTRAPRGLTVAEPPVSEPLRVALYCAVNAGQVITVSDETRQEAAALAAHLERPCAPAGAERVVKWLVKLNLAMAMPVPDEAFPARASAIAEALADMPAAVFSTAARLDAARELKFFPGAHELVERLGPAARDLVSRFRALRAIADHVPPPSPPPMTQEERESIVNEARAKRLAEASPAPPARKVVASVLTPEQLKAIRASSPIRVH